MTDAYLSKAGEKSHFLRDSMDASRRPERLWSDTRRKGALQPIKEAPTASFTADEFPCRQHGRARVRPQARQRSAAEC